MTEQQLERANSIQEDLEWMTRFFETAKGISSISINNSRNERYAYHELNDCEDPVEIRDFLNRFKEEYTALLELLIEKRKQEFEQL